MTRQSVLARKDSSLKRPTRQARIITHDDPIADQVRREVLAELASQWQAEGRQPWDEELQAITAYYGPLKLAEVALLLGLSSKQSVGVIEKRAGGKFAQLAEKRFGRGGLAALLSDDQANDPPTMWHAALIGDYSPGEGIT